jgi:dienelactone hydrolase
MSSLFRPYRTLSCAAVLIVICLGTIRASGARPAPVAARSGASPLAGFELTGDPASASGAMWTYKATSDGVSYDLRGILLKPAGAGPFPAVIISHGMRGNVLGNPRVMATLMVSWGLVCIATNYTHSSGVPIGSPGDAREPGASLPNLQRAHKLLDILRSLGYVDMTRVAAHGHSMGAYVTSALVGAYSSEFRVASHTAGGVRPPRVVAGPAPTERQVSGIQVPYQIHHGRADEVVPLAYDERLASLLAARNVPHEIFLYPGASHTEVILNREVFARIHDWYAKWGMFDGTGGATRK